MIQVIAYPHEGEGMVLPNPVSAQLDMDLYIPADQFEGKFPVEQSMEEFSQIKVLDQLGLRILFYGIVDEQRETVTPEGRFLEIEARSMAALLTDNEAEPQSYTTSSLELIFERHAQPYGLTGCEGPQTPHVQLLEITSGMSEWDAVETFCTAAIQAIPRVTPRAVLYCGTWPMGKEPAAVLDNMEEGTVKYTELEKITGRIHRISSITLRPSGGEGQTKTLYDEEARQKGIMRRRLEVYTDSILQAEIRANQQLAKGKQEFMTYRAVCVGEPPVPAGEEVVIRDKKFGTISGLTLRSLCYQLDGSREQTQILACEMS